MTNNKLIAELFAACTNSVREYKCAVHLSMYCMSCTPATRLPCKECLYCQAAMRIAPDPQPKKVRRCTICREEGHDQRTCSRGPYATCP